MSVTVKIFNSVLISFIWTRLIPKSCNSLLLTRVDIVVIFTGLVTAAYEIIIKQSLVIEIIRVVIVGLIACTQEKRFSLLTMNSCSITFMLAKGIWLVGTILSAMILPVFSLSSNHFALAVATCVPDMIICQLLRELTLNGIVALGKRLVAIITFSAWVLYGTSYELLTGLYTGEDNLTRAYAVLALVSLFVILTIFLAKAGSNERKNRDLVKHIDELVHEAHRSKELIPAIIQEIYMMQLDIQQGEASRLSGRIAAAIDEISNLQREIDVETQQSYIIDQAFSSTGLDILDSQIMSEQLRALQHGVNFEVIVNSPVTSLIGATISQLHLQRLIGDLYRDALAATKECTEAKEIMLTMGMINESYQIRICDTGVMFPTTILNNLGVVFQSSGRNHYGYADIFEILNECSASISIEEFLPQERMFTKAITVRFDGLAKLRVSSYRPEILDRVSDVSLVVEHNKEREECLR